MKTVAIMLACGSMVAVAVGLIFIAYRIVTMPIHTKPGEERYKIALMICKVVIAIICMVWAVYTVAIIPALLDSVQRIFIRMD